MIIKSPLHTFCEKKGIPDNLRMAFSAYLRSVYAERFGLNKDSDTIHLTVSHLLEDQLELEWLEFVNELKRVLSQ